MLWCFDDKNSNISGKDLNHYWQVLWCGVRSIRRAGGIIVLWDWSGPLCRKNCVYTVLRCSLLRCTNWFCLSLCIDIFVSCLFVCLFVYKAHNHVWIAECTCSILEIVTLQVLCCNLWVEHGYHYRPWCENALFVKALYRKF